MLETQVIQARTDERGPVAPPPSGPLPTLRRDVDGARGTVALWVMLVALACAVLIAMAEIDRLIATVVAPVSGASNSLSSVIGPLSFLGQDAWKEWASSLLSPRVGSWIIVSVALDVVFVACYAVAIYLFTKWALPAESSRPRRMVKAICLAEGIEAVILITMAIGLLNKQAFLPWPEVVAALGKWTVIVVIVVVILRTEATRKALGGVIRRGWQALWFHRLSAVPVALLAVLACVPAEGVLDQLPDVQRQWIGADFGRYFGAAAVSIGVACICAFALGRARTRRAVYRFVLGRRLVPRKTVQLIWWWAIPAVAWALVAAIAMVSHLVRPSTRDAFSSGDWGVLWAPLGWGAVVFVAVPVAVVLLSLWLETCSWPGDDRPDDARRAYFAWLAGDVLAIALIVVGALGMVRSMVLPSVLVAGGDDIPGAAAAWLLLVGGFVVSVVAPWLMLALGSPGAPVLRWLISSNDPTEPRTPPPAPTVAQEEHAEATEVTAEPDTEEKKAEAEAAEKAEAETAEKAAEAAEDKAEDDDDGATPVVAPGQLEPAADALSEPSKWRAHQIWQLGFVVVGAGALLLLAMCPGFAAGIGPVATTVLAVTAWTAVLGAFAVALQEYEPLALFRALRLRATPVLTLGLTIPLIYGAAFSALSLDGRLHEIRTLPADQQVTVADEADITGRLADNRCIVRVGDSLIRPVLLVAAEGGGIRAAYWAGRAMEELAATGCLGSTVLVASGISGGSVGLTLTTVDPDEPMRDKLTRLADPGTLATAVSGLFVGDAIAAAMGVKLPSEMNPADGFTDLGSDPFGFRWRDRAALIETGWISQVPGLAAPYSPAAGDTAGYVLLNSTDVDSGCRVVIGSLAVTAPAGTAPPTQTDERCERPTSQPAVSWWLRPACRKLVDTATAAMLSARFPVVTPGGRLPEKEGCDGAAQLVDGGYAEGTGLGTLADLAPQIASTLRQENAHRQIPYVPIVVYLRNSSGFDIVKSLSDVTAEPLVPLVGYAAKATQLTDAAWLQRLSGSLSTVCAADGQTDSAETCNAAVAETRKALSGQTVVISPSTRPAVVPPLGWALSEVSMQSLEAALKAEKTCPADEISSLRPVRLCTLASLEVVAEGVGGGVAG
jgi:hypothetical protein